MSLPNKIVLRNKGTLNKWVDVSEGIKLKIDYPTDRQEELLEEKKLLVGETKAGKKVGMYQYAKLILKYSIKDWRGIFDEEGNEVKCIIVDNEVQSDLLWRVITHDTENALALYMIVAPLVEFDETDKKK